MATYRKPIPKTQKDISNGLQQPYDRERGNPNAKLNPNENETGISFNRSTKLSFKGDTVKPCLLYTSPSPRDRTRSRMPSSA